jgi:hypothetical protein
MKKPRTPSEAPRLVWRISELLPQGGWVDPSKVDDAAAPAQAPEIVSRDFAMSSFDLLAGTEVVEGDAESMSPELFDQFFKAAGEVPPPTGEKA